MNAKVSIEPLAEPHFEPLRSVLDAVARERRYLALLQAPPRDEAFAFYRGMLAHGQCHVAMAGAELVGWCDIQRQFGEARAHVGTLGIALLPAWRGRGVGRQLLDTAIATAWSRGLSRIELTVRDDNPRAQALYEKLGFQPEGLLRQAMQVDGQHHDCVFMALLRSSD